MFVRILTVAGGELRSLLRSHPYLLFLPVSALVVLLAPLLVLFAFRSRLAMAAQVGLSTATFFSVLLGLLAGAAALAREREGGLGDLLFARAVSPFEYVTGKWLGITGAAALAVAILGGVHLVAVAVRGGAPAGYLPLVAALLLAVIQGGLAAAVGLLFSSFLKSGPAFVAALAFVLLSQSLALLGKEGPLVFLLPRLPHLNLSLEAAFGPFPAHVFGLAVLHALLYTAFLLSLSAPLTARTAGHGE